MTADVAVLIGILVILSYFAGKGLRADTCSRVTRLEAALDQLRRDVREDTAKLGHELDELSADVRSLRDRQRLT